MSLSCCKAEDKAKKICERQWIYQKITEQKINSSTIYKLNDSKRQKLQMPTLAHARFVQKEKYSINRRRNAMYKE